MNKVINIYPSDDYLVFDMITSYYRDYFIQLTIFIVWNVIFSIIPPLVMIGRFHAVLNNINTAWIVLDLLIVPLLLMLFFTLFISREILHEKRKEMYTSGEMHKFAHQQNIIIKLYIIKIILMKIAAFILIIFAAIFAARDNDISGAITYLIAMSVIHSCELFILLVILPCMICMVKAQNTSDKILIPADAGIDMDKF